MTDRCNLRCLYCRSNARQRCIPHAQVLRYEEMARMVGIAAALGIGTLWNAMIKWAFSQIDEDLYAALGVPDDHERGYFMLFGRPAVQYHRTVQRDDYQLNRVRLI